jgi:hypothetical protein
MWLHVFGRNDPEEGWMQSKDIWNLSNKLVFIYMLFYVRSYDS